MVVLSILTGQMTPYRRIVLAPTYLIKSLDTGCRGQLLMSQNSVGWGRAYSVYDTVLDRVSLIILQKRPIKGRAL